MEQRSGTEAGKGRAGKGEVMPSGGGRKELSGADVIKFGTLGSDNTVGDEMGDGSILHTAKTGKDLRQLNVELRSHQQVVILTPAGIKLYHTTCVLVCHVVIEW